MSTYNNERFYWLQLKEDFFDEDAIDWLEDQPNGEKYSLFYLKLCLKSLRTNGILIRKVGSLLIPYDNIKLGELTKTDPDTVLVAMELLTKIGLVEILDNGELYITQVEHMIGSQSKSAFKKQQQRLTKKQGKLIEGGQGVDKCPPNIDIEIEKEIDKELITRTLAKDKKELIVEEINFYEKLLELSKQHSPILYERHTIAINNGVLKKASELIELAEYIFKRYSEQEIIDLLIKTTKTYIVMPKYNNCDLVWVLNRFEQIKKQPLTENTQLQKQIHSQHFKNEREYTEEELNSLIIDINDLKF